jgi:hypothetical protein
VSVDTVPSLEELAKLMDVFPSADQVPQVIYCGAKAWEILIRTFQGSVQASLNHTGIRVCASRMAWAGY